MNNNTRSQGGWVASFVVIGAVLVLALLGGLYYVKSTQSGNDVADNTTSDTTTTDNGSEAEAPSNDTADDNTSSLEDADRANNDDPTSDSDETPRADEPSAEDNEADTNSDDEKSESDAPASDTLPETGPEDAIMQLVATGMLTAAGVAYWQSRR